MWSWLYHNYFFSDDSPVIHMCKIGEVAIYATFAVAWVWRFCL